MPLPFPLVRLLDDNEDFSLFFFSSVFEIEFFFDSSSIREAFFFVSLEFCVFVIFLFADGCCVGCTGVDGKDSEFDEDDDAFLFFVVDEVEEGKFDGSKDGVVVVEDEDGVAEEEVLPNNSGVVFSVDN